MTERSAKEQALVWLARREYAARELHLRLIRSGHGERDVHETLTALQESGYQSDERYAEARIRSRYTRGYGPLKVRSELRRFDVDESIISRHLESREYDWFESARRVLLKKYPDPPSDFKEKARRHRFLAARGFAMEQVGFAIDGYESG